MKKLTFMLLSIMASSNALAVDPPPVHDPVMAKGEDGRYYIFATGMGIDVQSSADMKEWRREKPVFNPKTEVPTWTADTIRGFRGHFWAPDISYHNGQWLLYYSISRFGRNTSAIGLATNKTLDPSSSQFKWEDKGMVIQSVPRKTNWNAIDPNLIVVDGRNYLTYGSFWDGIQLVELASDFKTPLSQPATIARRYDHRFVAGEAEQNFTIENGDTIEAGPNAIEAPFIIKRGEWYYLFVSFDYCCRGQASTYNTVYGRSRSVAGPYLDKDGKDMAKGGGTRLFGPDDKYFGIGHCSVYEIDGKWHYLSHAYDKSKDGRAFLFQRQLKFDRNGWIKPSKK